MKQALFAAAALALSLACAGVQAQGTTPPNADNGAGAGAGSHATSAGDTTASQHAPAARLSASDQEFFQKAAASGLAEVAAGQLADSQGSDDEVKTFGRQMVRDHSKANDELKQLAAAKGVTLPDAPDASHQKALDQLKQKQSGEFDRAYAKDQLKDHKDAVSLFKKAARSKDADIKAFAQKTLPVLNEHLTMVKALDSKLKKSK